ncbi:multidrug resistance-associated protein 4 [Corythoichthys intestinalis]|uniref:multidrug resistance-associated protein 4 n=1 Tax=Corythoichthys intestinalis TaxID=161448 RepID=UPI0025A6059B|nr:multidrug resistance-associated protein 4 [Corythoichthys intestinalis]XP_057686610.1 multidrug resistance-associated protein 4 [Corythoichthys intestinalis]XP_061802255.1 ATP-binding cassette sub-family C member 4-like [Nerophis lumbriciformis]
MEKVTKGAKTNPAASANLLSKVLFWWLNPLFRAGYKRTLEEEDLYPVLAEDSSEILGSELQRYWDHEVQEATKELRKPKLTSVIIRCYWKSYSVLGVFTLIEEVIKVVQVVLLGYMIRYFEDYDPNNQEALNQTLGYAAGLSICTLGLALLHHVYFFHVQRCGMKIRVAMCHMIYKKALCLSCSAMGKTTTGQIVNLLSNDVNKFDEVTIFLHFLWVGPLQAATVVGLLWLEIGPSCLAGMVVLMFLMPVQTLFGRLFSKFRSRTAILTDSRIRIMNEVVSGIRIIKMYAWEKPFAALVSDVRRKEIQQIMMSSYLRGLNMASFFCASKIIVFITFTLYVLLGNKISASRVFVTVSLYTAVRLTVTLFFPSAIEKLFESRVSVQRIQEFLLLDEMTKISTPLPLVEKQDSAIEIQDMMCYWDKNIDAPCLQNVSLNLVEKQLLAVIGPVGAGKSSLLSSILGELPVEKGAMKVKGQLTYAAQQPWVFPGTIRGNILFGKEMDLRKYERVLRACALKRDLELLPDGDLTLIGDRGATLSGGQKARINLARAVYQDADIYLLDDPLSAVDAEVGRHLFEQCICGLLKSKPRILVTHQLQYLKGADQIVVLKEGHMVAKGTYTELQRSGVDFTSLLKKDEEDESHQSLSDVSSRSRTLSQNSVRSQTSSVHSIQDGDHLAPEPIHTVAEESRAQGSIGLSMYMKYMQAGASFLFVMVVMLLNVLAQVAYIVQDWWLAYWAEEQSILDGNDTMIHNFTNVKKELDLDFYLGIYGGLTAATIIFGFLRTLLMFNMLVRSTQALHNSMFTAILRTQVRFFDVNPIGRVLNRFSKDIGQLDSIMPWTLVDFIQVFLQIVGVVAVAAGVIPWILIPVFLLLIVFLFLRRYFLETSRDIKRLESTTRSPVFSHLSSSLQGLWTIRAFRAEGRFQRDFDGHQDKHTAAWFLFLTTSRWFAVRLDGMCSLFVTVTTFGCLVLRDQLDAGSVGLALSYAITLMGMFQWGVRQSAEVENLMTSVERVVEYTELDSEASWETQKRPPPGWPSKGMVTFDGVSFSYSPDGPKVLHNLKVTFQPKDKVGIVGRTGAGKSSLVSALFRLSEPEGDIYIDGVLTSKLGLHDMRQKISIIPQDPVLFTGSMRKNLDPFNQHSDEELWNALQEVQLKSVVEELPGKLETVLAESGSNFSVGQRQLVCLARAILRKNRILIIDEATANVDPRTDELIQTTIREKFQECTVLTIAHRLNTIIDSDRILVLDAGRIHEYDEPYTLLLDSSSIFNKMVQQTGKQEAAALLEAAKKAFDSRRRPNLSKGEADTTDRGVVICETAL